MGVYWKYNIYESSNFFMQSQVVLPYNVVNLMYMFYSYTFKQCIDYLHSEDTPGIPIEVHLQDRLLSYPLYYGYLNTSNLIEGFDWKTDFMKTKYF